MEDEDLYDDEDDGESFELGKTVLPTGQEIGLGLRSIAEDDLLANMDWLYDDRAADSEDEDEFTGNASMPASSRYHDTVAIIIRKDNVARLFDRYHYQQTTSLVKFFELISGDSWCPPNVQSMAMDTILRQCLRMLGPSQDGNGYGSIGYDLRMGSYGSHLLASRAEHLNIFYMVAEFYRNNGLEDLVSKHLRQQIGHKHWAKSEELVRLIAKQVAQQTADGGVNVWED